MDDLLLEWIPYKFTNPSPAELIERRRQLDLAGLYGWLSPLAVLLLVFVYRQVTRDLPKLDVFHSRWKQLSWMLSSTSSAEYGSHGAIVLTVLYSSWLHFLIFRKTGNDYMHLTKSLAHVTISQFPIHYLLSLKSPSSPITLMTGLTHERLNVYHRNLGGIMFGFLFVHAAMYINFFIQLDILQKRIRHRDVQLGMLAITLVAILAVLTKPFVRQKYYHSLFYTSHVLIGFTLPIVVFFHVPYLSVRLCVAQAWIFAVANQAMRFMMREKVRGIIVKPLLEKGKGLLEITAKVSKASRLTDWIPGQHIYLDSGLPGPRNPFTIVSVRNAGDSKTPLSNRKPTTSDTSSKDAEITLVARNTGGPQTSRLASIRNDSNPNANTAATEFFLEGPYGEASQYMPRLTQRFQNSTMHPTTNDQTRDEIVLIAGGVGATYTIPIYETLVETIIATPSLHKDEASNPSPTSNKIRKENQTQLLQAVRFIWITRSRDEAQWGISILENLQSKSLSISPEGLNVEIHVTGPSSSLAKDNFEPATGSKPRNLNSESKSHKGIEIIRHHGKRPGFRDLLGPSISGPDTNSITTSPAPTGKGSTVSKRVHVLTCGPPTLVADLRETIQRIDLDSDMNRKGGEVEWVIWEEQFGFGGS